MNLNRNTWLKVPCPTCRGKGTKGYERDGKTPRKCPLCKGRKEVKVPNE